jgi:hypothetical protein
MPDTQTLLMIRIITAAEAFSDRDRSSVSAEATALKLRKPRFERCCGQPNRFSPA